MNSNEQQAMMGRVLKVIANDFSDGLIERWINFNQHDWQHFTSDGACYLGSTMPGYAYEDYEQ